MEFKDLIERVKSGGIQGFSFDSRVVKKGDLFFALKGNRVDGHDYLKEVGLKGGAVAVVDAKYRGETAGLTLVRVDDVTVALQRLAQEVQAGRKQRVVAVTGSVGKTTTKEFLATLLAQKYTVAKTPGNSNTQVSLPLAILNSSGEEEIFVAEMGMWHAGEIGKLVQIAPPEIGLITKIAPAGIGFFENGLEGIAAAKAEIFSHSKTVLGVVGQAAMQYVPIRESGCPKTTFGLAPEEADYVWEGGVVREKGKYSPPIRLSFAESHLCEDFVAAATVARILGLTWEQIREGARELKPFDLRFEKVERNGAVFINDCYNANPESMRAALVNLPAARMGGKTIAVLGEMVDLGKYSEQGHRQVAELALTKADHLLCYGRGCLPMLEVWHGKPAEFFRDLQELKTALFEMTKPGDVVLIKGSKVNQLWQILA